MFLHVDPLSCRHLNVYCIDGDQLASVNFKHLRARGRKTDIYDDTVLTIDGGAAAVQSIVRERPSSSVTSEFSMGAHLMPYPIMFLRAGPSL